MNGIGFSPESNDSRISAKPLIKPKALPSPTGLIKPKESNATTKEQPTSTNSEAHTKAKEIEANKNAKHIEEVTKLKEQAKTLELSSGENKDWGNASPQEVIYPDDTPL